MIINNFLMTSIIFFNIQNVHALEIEHLNEGACNVLRVQRRAQIYESVGIDKLDSLNKKIVKAATPQEIELLK